jgi:hypothetical protein
MKITKIYCDCCKREIFDIDKTYQYPLLNTSLFMCDGTIQIDNVDVCIDCLENLSDYFKRHINTTR